MFGSFHKSCLRRDSTVETSCKAHGVASSPRKQLKTSDAVTMLRSVALIEISMSVADRAVIGPTGLHLDP